MASVFLQKYIFPCVGWLGACYLKSVLKTGRWDYDYHPQSQNMLDNKKAAIAIFWHGRIFMMSAAKPADICFNVMVSKNDIGILAGHFAKYFNVSLTRGSSHNPKKPNKYKGGGIALKEMIAKLSQGIFLAFTPDGPKGPARKMNNGAIIAAKKAKVPILPVSFSVKYGKTIQSWDSFLVPYPFSYGIIACAAPIYYDDDMSDEAIERDCLYTQNILNALTDDLDKRCGRKI